MLKKLENFMNNTVAPFSEKLRRNKVLTAMSMALMIQLPVMIGSAIFMLMASFPVQVINDFFNNIGLTPILEMLVAAQNNFNPVILAFLIAYIYAKNEGVNPIPSGLFAFWVYLLMVPMDSMQVAEHVYETMYNTVHLGPNGIIFAIISSIIVAKLYVYLMKKKIVLKMPESVPPMIAQSFEPIPVGIIILGIFIGLNYAVSFSPYDTVFQFIGNYIQRPILAIGANIPALMILYILVNLLWFFGVHPAGLNALYQPIFSLIIGGNIRAYLSGEALPFQPEFLVNMVGNVYIISMGIALLIVSKSAKFKAIRKIAFVPSIFNISEPMVFGLPLMLNPIFLFPLVLSPILSMGLMTILMNIFTITVNPLAQMGALWTMPHFITAFLVGGNTLGIIMIVIILLNVLLWLPFFKIADNNARKAEVEFETTEENTSKDVV